MTALHNPPSGSTFLAIQHEFGTGAPWENVLHFLVAGAITDSDIDDLCAAVLDVWITQVQVFLNHSDIVLGARAQHFDGDSWLEGTGTADAPGSNSGTALAVGSCIVASWRGGWHYRGGKPRSYISGISAERLSTSRDVDPAYLGDLATAFAAFLDGCNAITTTNITACSIGAILGRTHTAAGTFAPFTGVHMNPVVASQRRRNRQP